ncbi:F-box only protein 48-like [Pelobates fuscus]|uniref:F-box only protein 48-like n=1 Tax=Pelobates fuscus TaxID=191477 RepID=UPI002FE4D6EE
MTKTKTTKTIHISSSNAIYPQECEAHVLASTFSKMNRMNEPNNIYLDNIPPEILCQILGQLDLQDICAVSKTCKLLNEIVETDTLWKKHCLAIANVCQLEIVQDGRDGYTWKETFKRNYQKSKVKQEWLDGKYSNIPSFSDLPNKSMWTMNKEDWGEILEAELRRP